MLSEETFSAPVTLAAPNPPTVSVAIQGADGSKPVERTKSLGNDDAGNAVEAVTPTLTVQDVTVTLTADQPVSGSWYLNNTDAERAKENGDPCGTFENQSLVEIPLTALRSQGHTLHIEGVNAQGDGFSTEFVFGIDDVAPVLAVNSPVNGAVAEGDVIHVEGMTDAAAVLTVSLNGAAVSVPTPTAADGCFVFDIPLTDAAKGQFKNKLTLTASDDLGNAITRTFTITNERITKLKEVAVWVGGTNVTNYNGRLCAGYSVRTKPYGDYRNRRDLYHQQRRRGYVDGYAGRGQRAGV